MEITSIPTGGSQGDTEHTLSFPQQGPAAPLRAKPWPERVAFFLERLSEWERDRGGWPIEDLERFLGRTGRYRLEMRLSATALGDDRDRLRAFYDVDKNDNAHPVEASS